MSAGSERTGSFSVGGQFMAENIVINANARARAGKGAARQVRREGKVPGVIYGNNQAAETISLDRSELLKTVQRGKFLSTVFDISIDGKMSRVIPREVQVDPVKDLPIHVDFQRVDASSRIRVNVPCRFINEGLSPGLKRGGVLNVVRHEIEVICPVEKIPAYFEFSLEGLEIGRSVHISAIKMPEGVKPTILDRDFTVATIAGAKAEEEETKPTEVAAVEAGAAAEGEAAPAAAAGEAKAAAPAGGKEAAGKAAAAAKAPAAGAGDKGKK
jgi:large subunit ribosomal protein L25